MLGYLGKRGMSAAMDDLQKNRRGRLKKQGKPVKKGPMVKKIVHRENPTRINASAPLPPMKKPGSNTPKPKAKTMTAPVSPAKKVTSKTSLKPTTRNAPARGALTTPRPSALRASDRPRFNRRVK